MKEHRLAREAFDQYWRLGADRSIERLRGVLDATGRAPHLRTLYRWSADFHWQDRIADLEHTAAEEEQARRIEEARQMNERHLNEGLLLQRWGAERLTAMEPERATASDATRAIIEGARLERDARGPAALEATASPRSDALYQRLTGMTEESLADLVDALERERRDGRGG